MAPSSLAGTPLAVSRLPSPRPYDRPPSVPPRAARRLTRRGYNAVRRDAHESEPRGDDDMASEHVVEVNGTNWEAEVVKSSVPVLVDFWAVWCGPCRQLSPTIDKIANDFNGKVKVAKLN